MTRDDFWRRFLLNLITVLSAVLVGVLFVRALMEGA